MHDRAAEWEPRCGERVAVTIVRGDEALDRVGDVLHVLGEGDERLYTISVLTPPEMSRRSVWHVTVPLHRLEPDDHAPYRA